jgi:hypothetical protein
VLLRHGIEHIDDPVVPTALFRCGGEVYPKGVEIGKGR